MGEITYRVIYIAQVVKRDIPRMNKKDRDRVSKAIEDKLTTEPDMFGKPLRHSLKGHWSLRVGPYRVIYRIEKTVVRIVYIGFRSTVYPDTMRRIFGRE